MVRDALKGLNNSQKPVATYTIGVIQSSAHRILNKTTAKILLRWKITPLDWAMLGTLFEKEASMSVTDIARYLGVAPPLVTRTINILEKRGFVQRQRSKEDGRVRSIVLIPEGQKMVREIEPVLRTDMKKLLEGLSPQDYSGYIRVISVISNLERR